MRKGAVVETNDPQLPTFELVITGTVEHFAEIKPTVVRLVGKAGQPLAKTVTIVPAAKYPFDITDVRTKRGKDITVSLENRGQEGRPAWAVTVENTRKTSGRYFDVIDLTTTFAQRPNLRISVYGNIAPADTTRVD